jgi:hypothetical protein
MRTHEEVIAFIDVFERELFASARIRFTRHRKWSDNFPESPGIYAIYDNTTLLYVGESANIKERMKEVKRTVNHAFRKKLGRHLYNGIIVNGKFSDEIESNLNEYYLSNLSFVFRPLIFGRLEVETHLINRNKETLLNSIGVRGTN